jgi:hypothetical protein
MLVHLLDGNRGRPADDVRSPGIVRLFCPCCVDPFRRQDVMVKIDPERRLGRFRCAGRRQRERRNGGGDSRHGLAAIDPARDLARAILLHRFLPHFAATA